MVGMIMNDDSLILLATEKATKLMIWIQKIKIVEENKIALEVQFYLKLWLTLITLTIHITSLNA